MPRAGENHRQAMLVAGRDHFRIPPRTARLDHCRDASRCRAVDRVLERKKRVRASTDPLTRSPAFGLRFPPSRRGSSARHRRPTASAPWPARSRSISRAGNGPGEFQVGQLRSGRLGRGDHLPGRFVVGSSSAVWQSMPPEICRNSRPPRPGSIVPTASSRTFAFHFGLVVRISNASGVNDGAISPRRTDPARPGTPHSPHRPAR